MGPAIFLTELEKYYDHVHALQGIELTVEQGEFFGLLGPNGAGKSTLINILAGLVKPTKGRAYVNGFDIEAEFRDARQSIGIVPQEIVQDVFFTVEELLKLQSGFYGLGPDNKAWIQELLDILGLADKAKSNMRQLSGGMKRRVMIAQAMVHNPPILILDEPTAGVDVEMRESLWAFITRLHEMGTTIILTTHYLEEAQALCDRIAIIDHGKCVALSDKASMMAQFAQREMTIEVASSSVPAALLEYVSHRGGDKVHLHFQPEVTPMQDILSLLVKNNHPIADIKISEPHLEDVFRKLTKKDI